MRCKVTMLNVGQGVMNLIEIYDTFRDGEHLVNLSLVDCGGELSPAGEESCKYVRKKMQERYRFSSETIPKLYLDNLLISHRDKDHLNLFLHIFELLEISGGTSAVDSRIIADRPIPNENIQQSFSKDIYINQYIQEVKYATNSCDIEMLSFYSSNDQSNIVRIKCRMESDSLSLTWGSRELMIWKDKSPIALAFYKSNELVLLYFPEQSNRSYEKMDFPNTYEKLLDFMKFLINDDFTGRGIPINVSTALYNVMQKHSSKEDINEILQPQPTTSGIWIGAAYIGGNQNQKTKEYENVKELLGYHCGNHNNNDIDPGQVLKLYKGYQLTVLERLVIESKRSGSVVNNSSSLVLVLSKEDDPDFQKVLFPGDADVHTFTQMLNKSMADPNYLTLFQKADWVAPHHGSHSFRKDEECAESSAFYSIIKQASTQKMCISAGENNKHGHPHVSFVQMMLGYYEHGWENAHAIKYNLNDTKSAQWEETEIRKPLYTHITEIPKPYRSDQSGLHSPPIQMDGHPQEISDDKLSTPAAAERKYFGTPASELFFYRK